MKFNCGDADKASFVTVLDEERDVHILAKTLSQSINADPVQPVRGVVVELRPRTFKETAAHFKSASTPVTWPADEFDVD
jgi:hypothetical protein